MRDMTPDELDAWLDQRHVMLVKTVSMGSVDAKVDCGFVSDYCRYWDSCAACLHDIDEDRAHDLQVLRHGIWHRWDGHEDEWRIPTANCMIRHLPMSTYTENMVLRSSLEAGDAIAVNVAVVWEDHRWCVEMTPENGTWEDL